MEEKIVTEQTVNWEELGISNDFLFGKVMQDAELCKELLQRILPDMMLELIQKLVADGRLEEIAKSKAMKVIARSFLKNTIYKPLQKRNES